MIKTKYLVFQTLNESFGIKNDLVVDVLDGFNEKIIEKISSNRYTHLYYKSKPLQIVCYYKNGQIFPGSHGLCSILVIKNPYSHDNYLGLPVDYINGCSTFDDPAFPLIKLFSNRQLCSYSLCINDKLIHILDASKIAENAGFNKYRTFATAGIKIHCS
jgi:hypothetical protein